MTVTNKHGQSAYAVAVDMGMDEVLVVLRKHGVTGPDMKPGYTSPLSSKSATPPGTPTR